MNQHYDQFVMNQIGFIPQKTHKILHKNKTRANKANEEKDFERAWGSLPGDAGSKFFMNKFYQENKQERKPSKPLPKDIMKNVKILEKI